MKNKFIALATSAVMASALCIGFAGCSKQDGADLSKVFAPVFAADNMFYEGTELTTLKDYDSCEKLQSYMGESAYFYKFTDTDAGKYAVYNALTGKVVYSGTQDVSNAVVLSQSYNAEYFEVYDGENYSYFDKDGSIAQSQTRLTQTDFYYTSAGEVELSKADFEGKLSSVVYCGDYQVRTYLGNSEEGASAVYTKEGKFVRVIDNNNIYIKTTNSEGGIYGSNGTKYIVQISHSLPSDASDYDYYDFSKKYSVQTYVYDIVTGEKVYKENFPYILKSAWSVSYMSREYTGIEAYDLTADKEVGEKVKYIILDKDLNVYIDLDDYLKGCNAVNAVGEYLMLSNNTTVKVYEGNKAIAEYPQGAKTLTQSGYFQVGDNYYSPNGTLAFTATEDMTVNSQLSSNGIIYYTESATNNLCAFDGNKNNTAVYGTAEQAEIIENKIIVMSDAQNNVTSVISVYSGELICKIQGIYGGCISCPDGFMLWADAHTNTHYAGQ